VERFGRNDIVSEIFEKTEDKSVGGIQRHVVSVSFNKSEFAKLKKLQANAPAQFLQNSTSAFIKFKVLG